MLVQILVIYQFKYLFCADLEQIAHPVQIADRELLRIIHHHRKTIHLLSQIVCNHSLLNIFKDIRKGHYLTLRHHGLDKVVA
jgi:hypothetical protein